MRQTALFFKADPDYGRRVAEGLGLELAEVERLAGMSQEERGKSHILKPNPNDDLPGRWMEVEGTGKFPAFSLLFPQPRSPKTIIKDQG